MKRLRWAAALLGACLFVAPWVFGTSQHMASSANAWIVGVGIVVATLGMPTVSGPRTAELMKVGLGAWLLAAPFALHFAASGAAWCAWVAGVLILALADTLDLVFDFSSWLHAQRLRYQARRISPERLLRCGASERSVGPEQLCRQIAERSYQIRLTLLGQTSALETGMCLLGYQACVDDRVRLKRLIDEELAHSGLLRRAMLRTIQRRAARSLARVREVIPPGAPHVWHRSFP